MQYTHAVINKILQTLVYIVSIKCQVTSSVEHRPVAQQAFLVSLLASGSWCAFDALHAVQEPCLKPNPHAARCVAGANTYFDCQKTTIHGGLFWLSAVHTYLALGEGMSSISSASANLLQSTNNHAEIRIH